MSAQMIPALLKSTLRNDVRVELVAGRIWSTLPVATRRAPYDRIARVYDAVIGNRLYNRVLWGVSTAQYHHAASRLIDGADTGPILDFGCGSLVFTHAAYARHPDRLILFDRSLGMLERAVTRLPRAPLVQGDALSPAFMSDVFAAAMSWGMLHIFGTQSQFLEQLAACVRPGGRAAISTLVPSGRPLGDRMLRVLHRRGEIAEPEAAATVTAAFAAYFALDRAEQFGNMLFLEGRRT